MVINRSRETCCDRTQRVISDHVGTERDVVDLHLPAVANSGLARQRKEVLLLDAQCHILAARHRRRSDTCVSGGVLGELHNLLGTIGTLGTLHGHHRTRGVPVGKHRRLFESHDCRDTAEGDQLIDDRHMARTNAAEALERGRNRRIVGVPGEISESSTVGEPVETWSGDRQLLLVRLTLDDSGGGDGGVESRYAERTADYRRRMGRTTGACLDRTPQSGSDLTQRGDPIDHGIAEGVAAERECPDVANRHLATQCEVEPATCGNRLHEDHARHRNLTLGRSRRNSDIEDDVVDL